MSKDNKEKLDPKKILTIVIAAVVVIAVIIIGVIAFGDRGGENTETESNSETEQIVLDYNTNASTVFFLADGRVVSTDVEVFDSSKYNKDELATYVLNVINTYNDEHGKGKVTQKDFSVENNVARLILEYVDASVYQDFYGIELFNGTVKDAKKAGYEFDLEFARIENGEAVKCASGEVKSENDLKVAIIKANTRVVVEGKILYISAENVYGFSGNEVILKDNCNIFEIGVEETETETEETETEEFITDMTDIPEDGDPVGGVESEESTEIIFDFGDTEVEENKTEATQNYIYIIYQ